MGVTLWSSDVGPYVWHDFNSGRMRAEIGAVSRSGFRLLRLLLPWDAFMPDPSRVPDHRLRQLEAVLGMCAEESLRAIPVLNAQSLGGCVMLPPYAIDASRRVANVRTVTDGVVQPGAPRDQHTDSLLLEVQLRWLETLLDAFAGHDAVHMWDLGHDPASTMRPRRIAEQAHWCETLAAVVHEHGERCMLTLSDTDLTTARGVRPGVVAASLDAVAFAVEPVAADAAAEVLRMTLLGQLSMRMTAAGTPIAVHVAAPRPSVDASRCASGTVAALVDVGCSGVHALWWANTGPRTDGVAPFDHAQDLAERGVVDVHGNPTAFGSAWLREVAREPERHTAMPWPAQLDIDDYYANLPESWLELQRAWKAENGDVPAILM